MGHIDTTRSIRNSNYIEQIKEVSDVEFGNLVCEDGALVKLRSKIYVGLNGNWVQLVPMSAETLNLGWERIDDTTNTVSNHFEFLANTEYKVPNDGLRLTKMGLSVYDAESQKFILDNVNNTFILTVAFKGHLNTSNGHIEMFLKSAGSTPFSRVADIFNFPKGNGIEHTYSRVFQFYADEEICTDGRSEEHTSELQSH